MWRVLFVVPLCLDPRVRHQKPSARRKLRSVVARYFSDTIRRMAILTLQVTPVFSVKTERTLLRTPLTARFYKLFPATRGREFRRWRRRTPPSGHCGRHRYRAGGRFPRRPLWRSPLPRPPQGWGDRTWYGAEYFP